MSLVTNLCIVNKIPLVGCNLCFDVLWHLSSLCACVLIDHAGAPHLRMDSSCFFALKSTQGSQAQVLVVTMLKDGGGHACCVQRLVAIGQAELRVAIEMH
jgi:hypothetical protein